MENREALRSEESRNNETKKTSPALVAFAWLLVGIPLAWGVYQTLIKSLDLFK